MAEPNWNKINEEKRNQIILGQAINIVLQHINYKKVIEDQAATIAFIDDVKGVYKTIKDLYKELREDGEYI